MNISEQLTCLYSAKIEAKDGSYVIEIPKEEVDRGYVDTDNAYQFAVISLSTKSAGPTENDHKEDQKLEPESKSESKSESNLKQPPVVEGETRLVEIDDIGDQGDGLTRVDRGFVVIVPDAEKGERVRIKIDTVRENVAFANVIERISYYD